MKDVSGVQWLPAPVAGGYGPLIGRQDEVSPIPESWSPTPANTPEEAPSGEPESLG